MRARRVLRQLFPGASALFRRVSVGRCILVHTGHFGDLRERVDAFNPLQRQIDAVRDEAREVVGLVLILRIDRIGVGDARGDSVETIRPLLEDRVVRVGGRLGRRDMLHVGIRHDQHVGRLFDGHVLAAAIVVAGRIRIRAAEIMRRVEFRPLARRSVVDHRLEQVTEQLRIHVEERGLAGYMASTVWTLSSLLISSRKRYGSLIVLVSSVAANACLSDSVMSEE